MVIDKIDFHSIFVKEGTPFYNELLLIDKEIFNNWVSKVFLNIKEIKSFSEVVPSKEIQEIFIRKGYHHIESQCHYSAKAISLLDSEYEYWTGFIYTQDCLYGVVTHSYNVYKNSIIDFARVNRQLEIHDIDTHYLPHVYYGIHIPTDFVKQYTETTFNEHSMKPLLYEWYNHVTNEQIEQNKWFKDPKK